MISYVPKCYSKVILISRETNNGDQSKIETAFHICNFSYLGKLLSKYLICQTFDCFRDGIYVTTEDLERVDVLKKEIEDIRSGEIVYAHFGLECKTWSILGRFNGGSST